MTSFTIHGKRYKIYKTASQQPIQFSFVLGNSQHYFYINDWNAGGEWRLSYVATLCWVESWPHRYRQPSNWLEILVVSGWTKQRVIVEINKLIKEHALAHWSQSKSF